MAGVESAKYSFSTLQIFGFKMLFFTMRENVQFFVVIMLVLFHVNHTFHWSRYDCAMFVLVDQRSQYYLKSEQNLNMRQNSEDFW